MINLRQFVGHVGTMLAGTALAQLVPFIAAPFLTRLYTPAEFGVFASVVAVAAVLSICATLRYELAVVLPAEEAVAANLAAIAVSFAIFFSVCVGVVLLVLPDTLRTVLGAAVDVSLAIPLLTFLMACTQILNFTANRERKYFAMASGAVTQQTIAALVGIGLGLAVFPFNGLVVGRVAGHFVVVVYLATALAGIFSNWKTLVRGRSWRSAARAYRQFPQFNVPYSLVGTFSREFIILALTAFHQLSAAGFYGLARTIVTAPISFLSSSLSQVFYKEAAVSIGTPEFARLTLTILQFIAIAFAPFFVLGWFWAPEVFSFVFGPQWREAGD